MNTVSRIFLLDGQTGGGLNEAKLLDGIQQSQIDDWQRNWNPALPAILRRLARQKVPASEWPQTWQWDWIDKIAAARGTDGIRWFSIVARGQTQGFAPLDLRKTSREPGAFGEPLVYVHYLEVAPWNWTEFGVTPRFRGTGLALMMAATATSIEAGFKGRLGLHSLPQADSYYRKIGMTDLGRDPIYQNLRYFEMTSEQARTLLEQERGS